jgi:hypothetical protein
MTTTNIAATIAALFATIGIEVNKKVGGKFQKVGAVDIFVPTLEAAGFTPERQKDAEGNDMVEDGLPVYKEESHNWIQGAILAQVKAQARNKLVSGTATLKDGAAIATDWATLTAEGERGGNGDALAIVREVKAAFAKHVSGLGKSQKAQETLTTLFGSKQSLALQSPENKAKMEQYVTDFAATLDEANLTRFMKYLEGIQTACANTEEVDDF